MSIADPLACGFVKTVTYKILTEKHSLVKSGNENAKQFKGRVYKYQFEKYNDIFSTKTDDRFLITYNQFTKNFTKIIEIMRNINKAGRHGELLTPSLNNVNTRLDLWYQSAITRVRPSTTKKVFWCVASVIRAMTGSTVVPALSLAIQKVQ